MLAEIIGNIVDLRNKGTNLLIASVVSPPPNLKIKFSEQEIPSEQIFCSNYLLPHYHREYTIDGIIDNIKINMQSYSGDNTTSTAVDFGPDSHTHAVPSIAGSGKFEGAGTYHSHKDIWLEDTLKVGDEVLVAVVGVFYVVVTKITKMPSGAIEGV